MKPGEGFSLLISSAGVSLLSKYNQAEEAGF